MKKSKSHIVITFLSVSIVSIITVVTMFDPFFVFSQAALVEKKEKTAFEKKHMRLSDREAVKIDKVLNHKTIQVTKNNWDKKIELIGIELPQWSKIKTVFDQNLLPSHQMKAYKRLYYQANSAIKNFVSSGDVLFIEQDTRKQNAFGSLLVYLYAPNRRIINIELVRQGYALPVTDVDNKAYDREFTKALREAIDHKRGWYKIWELRLNNKW